MNDIITLFKEDLHLLIDDLIKKSIIKDFEKKNIGIDYSSKNKQGDISTNIFLLLLKKNIDKNFNIKKYVLNYLNNLTYIENIELAKAGFLNVFIQKKFIIKL